jgi:hypothetical protein
MYYKLDTSEHERIDKISKITCTDYDLKGDFILIDNMMCLIEDLLVEYETLEEKIKDMEQDIENNYELKEVNPYIEYGVRENEFL